MIFISLPMFGKQHQWMNFEHRILFHDFIFCFQYRFPHRFLGDQIGGIESLREGDTAGKVTFETTKLWQYFREFGFTKDNIDENFDFQAFLEMLEYFKLQRTNTPNEDKVLQTYTRLKTSVPHNLDQVYLKSRYESNSPEFRQLIASHPQNIQDDIRYIKFSYETVRRMAQITVSVDKLQADTHEELQSQLEKGLEYRLSRGYEEVRNHWDSMTSKEQAIAGGFILIGTLLLYNSKDPQVQEFKKYLWQGATVAGIGIGFNQFIKVLTGESMLTNIRNMAKDKIASADSFANAFGTDLEHADALRDAMVVLRDQPFDRLYKKYKLAAAKTKEEEQIIQLFGINSRLLASTPKKAWRKVFLAMDALIKSFPDTNWETRYITPLNPTTKKRYTFGEVFVEESVTNDRWDIEPSTLDRVRDTATSAASATGVFIMKGIGFGKRKLSEYKDYLIDNPERAAIQKELIQVLGSGHFDQNDVLIGDVSGTGADGVRSVKAIIRGLSFPNIQRLGPNKYVIEGTQFTPARTNYSTMENILKGKADALLQAPRVSAMLTAAGITFSSPDLVWDSTRRTWKLQGQSLSALSPLSSFGLTVPATSDIYLHFSPGDIITFSLDIGNEETEAQDLNQAIDKYVHSEIIQQFVRDHPSFSAMDITLSSITLPAAGAAGLPTIKGKVGGTLDFEAEYDSTLTPQFFTLTTLDENAFLGIRRAELNHRLDEIFGKLDKLGQTIVQEHLFDQFPDEEWQKALAEKKHELVAKYEAGITVAASALVGTKITALDSSFKPPLGDLIKQLETSLEEFLPHTEDRGLFKDLLSRALGTMDTAAKLTEVNRWIHDIESVGYSSQYATFFRSFEGDIAHYRFEKPEFRQMAIDYFRKKTASLQSSTTTFTADEEAYLKYVYRWIVNYIDSQAGSRSLLAIDMGTSKVVHDFNESVLDREVVDFSSFNAVEYKKAKEFEIMQKVNEWIDKLAPLAKQAQERGLLPTSINESYWDELIAFKRKDLGDKIHYDLDAIVIPAAPAVPYPAINAYTGTPILTELTTIYSRLSSVVSTSHPVSPLEFERDWVLPLESASYNADYAKVFRTFHSYLHEEFTFYMHSIGKNDWGLTLFHDPNVEYQILEIFRTFSRNMAFSSTSLTAANQDYLKYLFSEFVKELGTIQSDLTLDGSRLDSRGLLRHLTALNSISNFTAWSALTTKPIAIDVLAESRIRETWNTLEKTFWDTVDTGFELPNTYRTTTEFDLNSFRRDYILSFRSKTPVVSAPSITIGSESQAINQYKVDLEDTYKKIIADSAISTTDVKQKRGGSIVSSIF